MDITRRRELARRLLNGYVHGPAAATEATAQALAKVAAAEAVVLVEGISDQIAVETLAVVAAGTSVRSAWWSCRPARICDYALPDAVWSRWSWPETGGPVRRRRGERRPARYGQRRYRLARRGPTWSDWASTSASRIWRTS